MVINGCYSSVLPVKAGVPQGSVLGPLLFLVFFNDITQGIDSTMSLFADDSSLGSIVDDPYVSAQTLNKDLENCSHGCVFTFITVTKNDVLFELYQIL